MATKKSKSNKKLIIGIIVLIFCFVTVALSAVIFSLVFYSNCCANLNWVEDQRSSYYGNSQEIQSISDRFGPYCNNSPITVSRDSVYPKDALDATTVEEIREAIRGKFQSFQCVSTGIELTSASSGLAISGNRWGLLISNTEPTNYFKDGDCGLGSAPVKIPPNYQHCNSGSYDIFEKLDDNVYLFYYHED